MVGRAARAMAAAGALALGTCARPSAPPVPAGYPAAYADTITAAVRGRRLLIWSAVDRSKAAGLLNGFHHRYPALAVTYQEIPARDLNARFLAAVHGGGDVPDIVWSSAMDLQIKLVNDGYAQTYRSPEAAHLARWANWKNQAWGTTAEPIVFIYNRRLLDDAAMPKGHMALARFLEGRPPALKGKVATYNLPTSAVGYLYFLQDQQATHGFWRLMRAMAANGLRTFTSAEEVLGDVVAGRSAIGYDIVGSYAASEATHHPELGLVMPRDYTLVVSRIAMIPAAAPHPDAARLFLDVLLSRRGQALLAAQRMSPVRGDVAGPAALGAPDAPLRAIRVGPALLVDSDRLTRAYVLRRWRDALEGVEPTGGS